MNTLGWANQGGARSGKTQRTRLTIVFSLSLFFPVGYQAQVSGLAREIGVQNKSLSLSLPVELRSFTRFSLPAAALHHPSRAVPSQSYLPIVGAPLQEGNL